MTACGRKKEGRKECICMCTGLGAGIVLAARDLNVNQGSGDSFTKVRKLLSDIAIRENLRLGCC